jgi:hypothetical protein
MSASLRETGSCPSGQAPAGLDAPRFDPARITEAVALVGPSALQPIIKKAADEFYVAVLETTEDYLRENLDWNLKSHLATLERENQRMRTELHEVDRKLGGDYLGHERRLTSIGDLTTASNRYYSMIWAVAQKHEGEERHETALRYIRERETASAMSAGTAETPQEAQGEARQRGGAAETPNPHPESPSQ